MLTLHHLDFSRSTRVLWLLEELKLPHDIVRYERPVGGPAPKALQSVHPLGRSPVLVDGALTLAESSAILRYIDAKFGGGRFTPKDPDERAKHDELLDFVESGLAAPLLVPLTGGKDLSDRMVAKFAAQFEQGLDHVSETVSKSPYLMGDELTLADIQIVYVLAVAGATGALERHPAVYRYLERLMDRPALKQAIHTGGPMV